METTTIKVETMVEIVKGWREVAREYKGNEADETMRKFYEGAEYITTCILRELKKLESE